MLTSHLRHKLNTRFISWNRWKSCTCSGIFFNFLS